MQRYKDYGITIYHPNYEVWDKRLFELISPGKERYVGREEWHRRIFDAAEVFGPRYVIPNFVAGVEMAKPYGFETVDAAIASTTEGLDYFMSRGITPRFTTWCPEPSTPLGRDNPDGAPLEYHIRLLEAYRGSLEQHGLKPPPGYGVAGAGNAVFSVSSFMDTLGARRGHRRGGGAGVTRHHRRRCADALERGVGRGADAARAGGARAVPPARPRDLHGDADHQLHERVRRPVRLLRVLRAAEPGRAATCSHATTSSRRSTSCSTSAATSSASTAASTRSCRSTTTATSSRAVRERYGDRVEFYALTIAEFVYLADRAGLTHAEAAARLRDAGVHWVTGGGSEILTEDFRKRHAKFKYTVREYFEAQRAIVESGMKTTATMVIGFDEIARRAARAPAAHARLPGRLPERRLRRAVLVPLLDVQAVRHRVRRPGDLPARVLAAHGARRGSFSTTSSTSAPRC